jgi:regulator of sirC expression with transglutaminase-like and TPR domain
VSSILGDPNLRRLSTLNPGPFRPRIRADPRTGGGGLTRVLRVGYASRDMNPSPSRFERLAGVADGEVRLAEAALWVAADEYPGLDIPAWLAVLDGLGDAAAGAIAPAMDVDEAAGVVSALLFEHEGFRGNADDYYDPRNSFLNDVLNRRLGIPITLSVVYAEVARRAGLAVRGVGLPGHFIVRVERHGAHRLLDPFNRGATLAAHDCHALVRRVYGPDARIDPRDLRPVTTREIVTRMLANLKGIYTSRADWPRALRTIERLVTLAPATLTEVRDRGAIQAKLGNPRAAIRDWEAYLAGAPQADDAEHVRGNLRALRQAVAVLN